MENTNIEVDLTGDWREVIAAQEKIKVQGLSISYLPGKEATKKIIVGVDSEEFVANGGDTKDDVKIDSHYQDFAKYFANIGSQDITIDCGANVGLITEILAARSRVVYAFEPNPLLLVSNGSLAIFKVK